MYEYLVLFWDFLFLPSYSHFVKTETIWNFKSIWPTSFDLVTNILTSSRFTWSVCHPAATTFASNPRNSTSSTTSSTDQSTPRKPNHDQMSPFDTQTVTIRKRTTNWPKMRSPARTCVTSRYASLLPHRPFQPVPDPRPNHSSQVYDQSPPCPSSSPVQAFPSATKSTTRPKRSTFRCTADDPFRPTYPNGVRRPLSQVILNSTTSDGRNANRLCHKLTTRP